MLSGRVVHIVPLILNLRRPTLRRLSEKHKRWLILHTKKSYQRKLYRKYRATLKQTPRVRTLSLPEHLSFEYNFEETTDFFIICGKTMKIITSIFL